MKEKWFIVMILSLLIGFGYSNTNPTTWGCESGDNILNIDGEMIGSTPIHVTVEQGLIDVLV